MIFFFKKLFFIFVKLKFLKNNTNNTFVDLNFKKLDFTNEKQIKMFIFKKEFYKLQNRYVQSFDFLSYSKNLGGKIGINLSKNTIFDWYYVNKNKLSYPWSEDLSSKRFINIIYNYEFINSSSSDNESKLLNKIIMIHIYRVIDEFNNKKISEITSYDILAYTLSSFILKKINSRLINYIDIIITNQIDSLGMHKSYNILEHAKYINNLNELKNIFLYFNYKVSKKILETTTKMSSILIQYFHNDGSFPLFNGSNNNFTKKIYGSLNKEEYLKSREFTNNSNGIAFYTGKSKKLFFDVVQPNNTKISNNLSAGTLSFEFSCMGEKLVTNCGASESSGKNPEYLRYSAAHSTIILQNTNISEIRENNSHIKFPQSVTFNSSRNDEAMIFEGSHNGYTKRFNKVLKRKLIIYNNLNKFSGEDSIISLKNLQNRIIYHIRFHLVDGISYNFTNNKQNIILKTKKNNIWLFKSDMELLVEDSILVDKNITIPSKQIVIKGVATKDKQIRRWSFERI